MLFWETLIFYVAVGAAVAVAAFVAGAASSRSAQVFQAVTSLAFWPLYLPLLLTRSAAKWTTEAMEASAHSPPPLEPSDALSTAIAQVEAELASTLSGLDGWAEDVLARERGRIDELQRAWRAQAARIREMDGLLAEDEARSSALAVPGAPAAPANDRLRKSEEARRQNFEKLREVRRRAHDDLLGTLAWVRELVSMIQLAKFTGAPASRAGELVAQIAASVEGLSEVTGWR